MGKSSPQQIKLDFINLLKEQKNINRNSHWSDIKVKIDSDSRYRAVESSSRKEDWFREYIRKLDAIASRENSDNKRESDRRDRTLSSSKDKDKVVKNSRSSLSTESDRVRTSSQTSKSEKVFQSVIKDVIKDETLTWKEAKKLLHKDSRLDSVGEEVSQSKREDIFKNHIETISKQIKDSFYKLLNNCDSINLTTKWRDLKKIFSKESRFQKFLLNEKKWESVFNNWLEKRDCTAKGEFADLLKEKTNIIRKAKFQSSENETFLDDILSTLKEDKRFKALDSIQDKRQKLLEEFLDGLSESTVSGISDKNNSRR